MHSSCGDERFSKIRKVLSQRQIDSINLKLDKLFSLLQSAFQQHFLTRLATNWIIDDFFLVTSFIQVNPKNLLIQEEKASLTMGRFPGLIGRCGSKWRAVMSFLCRLPSCNDSFLE